MAITIEENKSFPLWFRNSNNYASEYARCLGNLPVGNQIEDTYKLTVPGTPTTYSWLGGVMAENGNLYGSPHENDAILKINTNTDTVSTFGSFVGTYKYAGGVLAPNGKIYFPPSSATNVLVLDPSDDSTYTFGSFGSGLLYWIGGTLNKEGTKIYCCPYYGNSILVIDIENETTYNIGGLSLGYKYGKIQLAPNGFIYCIPSDTSTILKIDTDNDTFTTFGLVTHSGNAYFSSILTEGGIIYSLPANNNLNVIKLDTNNDTVTTFTAPAGNQRAGCLAFNGKIYGCPSVGSTFLVLDPSDDSMTTISLPLVGLSTKIESMHIAPNGKVYGIPLGSTEVPVLLNEINGDKDFVLSKFNNQV